VHLINQDRPDTAEELQAEIRVQIFKLGTTTLSLQEQEEIRKRIDQLRFLLGASEPVQRSFDIGPALAAITREDEAKQIEGTIERFFFRFGSVITAPFRTSSEPGEGFFGLKVGGVSIAPVIFAAAAVIGTIVVFRK